MQSAIDNHRGLAAIFIGATLATSLSACYAKAGEHMVYDYVGTPYVTFDEEEKTFNHAFGYIRLDMSEKTITSGDAVLPLETCDSQDTFYCLLGGEVVFAVPKQGITQGSWTYKGFDFHDLGRQAIPVFGLSREVEVITAQRHGEVSPKELNIAYYSAKYGLLGFSVQYPDRGITETYFSTSELGYAALSN